MREKKTSPCNLVVASKQQGRKLKNKLIMKATIIIIVIVSLITVGLYYAPKGNNYIQWKREMIKSGQIK